MLITQPQALERITVLRVYFHGFYCIFLMRNHPVYRVETDLAFSHLSNGCPNTKCKFSQKFLAFSRVNPLNSMLSKQ